METNARMTDQVEVDKKDPSLPQNLVKENTKPLNKCAVGEVMSLLSVDST